MQVSAAAVHPGGRARGGSRLGRGQQDPLLHPDPRWLDQPLQDRGGRLCRRRAGVPVRQQCQEPHPQPQARQARLHRRQPRRDAPRPAGRHDGQGGGGGILVLPGL